MNYTLHQLRIFCKVCDCQSITRAAEALYLTQPAVSIQLKRLQNEFEIPLTEVINRKLYVTDFGKTVYQLAREILAGADRIGEAVHQYRGILTGNIHIASASTGKYVLPYFIADFARRHPGVTLTVDVTNKTQVVDSLRANETDFAIVSVIPEKLRLERIPLLSNELHLAAAPSYPGLPERMTAKRLARFPLIFREAGSATLRAMEEFLERNAITPSYTMRLQSNEAVKQAVRAGLGLSILPRIGIRNELQLGHLRIVPMAGLPMVTEWSMVYREEKVLSPAAAALAAHVEALKADIIAREFPEAVGVG